MARHHGATETMPAGDDVVQAIRDSTGGFGADYTFEATGNVRVMRQAVEAAREAWGLATMCGVAGKGETLDIVPRLLITGRRVTGSSFGGVKGRSQVPELVQRWLGGEIDVESLLSHRVRLDEIDHAFELMEAQDGIRSIIHFD
jgi:S-(hydroxymethyl)glutathione dehydrogenase/alcohol dehydrogenase